MEIVPPTGESHETSSLPCCVTSSDATTVFCTPVVSVVHASAAGTAASAARRQTETRARRIGPDDASRLADAQAFTFRSPSRGSIEPMRGALLFAVPALLLLAGCGDGARTGTPPTGVGACASSGSGSPADPASPGAAGTLDAAVQDAAAAPFRGGAVLVGGLTSADTSTDEIVTATRAGSQRVGRIPAALHDAAAVTIGAHHLRLRRRQRRRPARCDPAVDPRTGAAQAAGRLPRRARTRPARPSADGVHRRRLHRHALARHDRRVAPGRPRARRRAPAAHAALRGGRSGGRPARDRRRLARERNGERRRLRLRPRNAAGAPLGRLPAPTTHAAAASIGGVAFVIGGRGARPARRPRGSCPSTRRAAHPHRRIADRPLSDLAAVGDRARDPARRRTRRGRHRRRPDASSSGPTRVVAYRGSRRHQERLRRRPAPAT